ncbi:MAG: hypothetical protein J6V72_16520 [Kiritimatiellae bacterium]|nr:hypothetical protein [Kiritimatiellia bacterium]
MKKRALMSICGVLASGLLAGTTGSWTLKNTSDNYSSLVAAANWQDGYVPTNANDSLVFAVTSDNTNDRSWWWGGQATGAIFGNVALPTAANGLVFDEIRGYRQYRLRTDGNHFGDAYSFLDVSDFLGSFELVSDATLQIRAGESGETQQLHGLKVSGKPTLDVAGGVVELGNLSGEGTLVKSGSGELRLTGVSAAPGVRIRAEEGSVTLRGVQSAATPVAGAALHIDASRPDTITVENGVVQAIADTRGSTASGYYELTRFVGYPSLASWGDKQLINFGYCNLNSANADLKARWGECGSMACNETITGVKTMFVAFRWNADDNNGNTVFPLNDETGYIMRSPVPQENSAKGTNAVMLTDWSAWHLFMYQQYGSAYQCWAPQSIVTGDIRRDGEPVVYNQTPRGFRDALECLSINVNTNGMSGYALPWFSFKYLARMQNQGYTGGSQVGEILIYTNALTDAEQKQNIDYLEAKWGSAAGTRPWLAASLAGTYGTAFDVPSGETAYVKSVDTRAGVFVKTGGGTLAVRHIDGNGPMRVEGGVVEFIGGKAPVESGLSVSDPKPAPGITAHFDAMTWEDKMVFEPEGGTNFILRWNSLARDNKTAEHNLALMVTNATQTALTGMKPYLVDGVDGRKWVDFGDLTVSSSRLTDTPTSGWFRVTRLDNLKDKSSNHLREMFWVWKTRPAAGGSNPLLCGSAGQYWRYARPGKNAMLSSSSPYSGDANDAAFKTFLNAQWTLDGRPVDPLVDNYPEDVHVVRFSLGTARYVSGIGNDYDLVKGGFQLGEILMYSRELTDRERVETEAYLMKKWKGASHPAFAGDAPSAAQVVYAATPASIAATEGTVQMSFADDAAKPTLDTSDKTAIHIDVSDLTTVSYMTDANGDMRVTRIEDPRGNGKYAAVPSSTDPGHGCKMPVLRVGTLNGRNVLDLGGHGTADASCIRWWNGSNIYNIGSETAALIVYANRDEGYYADSFSTFGWGNKTWNTGGEDAIFDPNAAANPQATAATIYMDGVNRTNTAGGYPSGFHVFYMANGSGWGNNISGVGLTSNNNAAGGGMLLAEIYVFTTAPSAAERNEAIAYLMKKWGIGGQSFAAPSVGSISAAAGAKVKLGTTVAAASLSGAGTVEAPGLTNVTVLAATVTGAGTTECLTVDGEVALGANGTATVTFAPGTSAEVGFYPVLNASSFVAGTAATLQDWAVATVDAPRNVKGRLVVRDGAICLEIIPSGTVVIFR